MFYVKMTRFLPTHVSKLIYIESHKVVMEKCLAKMLICPPFSRQ